ncbi:MAG TPA: response regulator [Methylomirabilota bacterium]|nr:response regulator [Methylomirabilota bacterium]
MAVTKDQKERPLILLIENNESDVFLFRRALSKLNYAGDVRVVGSVSEARSFVENTGAHRDTAYFRTPQLIVSDFRLNGPTALEFIRWLRRESECPALPVVILSGAVQAEDIPQLLEAGADDVVMKTPDVQELAARLKDLLPAVQQCRP